MRVNLVLALLLFPFNLPPPPEPNSHYTYTSIPFFVPTQSSSTIFMLELTKNLHFYCVIAEDEK